MRLSSAVALALAFLLAALTVGTVVVAPVTAAAPSTDGSSASFQSQPTASALESSVQDGNEYNPERADTWQVIRLNVTESGDVRWTIESRFYLSANETDAFEQYAEAVSNGDRGGGYDVDQYDQFRVDAERSTGREMAFENERWNEPRTEPLVSEGSGSDDRKLGIISYSFTWTNFATVDDQRIHFGDAFVTDNGVWLPFLDDGQRLVIESPANYGIDTAPAEVQNGAVVYDGYLNFSKADFQMVFLRSSSTSTPGASPGPEPPSESASFVTVERVAAAFGGFVLVIVVASLAISRYQRSAWFDDASATGKSPAGTARPRSTETDGSGTAAVARRDDPAGIEHEFDETEAVNDGPAADGDGSIDDELLSDDERVRRLLERNGGRMKQATIVKETGWSDAKVSQLLSEMDDDDRIQKLRIGRENLITLPDVDPTEVD
ncbi:hypothetical protein [Haloterrigena salinisoli]|uniref:DUF7345 domain-containing protein n=1 Tax=Haloterrigena salinisoli TaxID=3132747 RepID=UPI0030D36DA8